MRASFGWGGCWASGVDRQGTAGLGAAGATPHHPLAGCCEVPAAVLKVV